MNHTKKFLLTGLFLLSITTNAEVPIGVKKAEILYPMDFFLNHSQWSYSQIIEDSSCGESKRSIITLRVSNNFDGSNFNRV
ncbi:MAG: hypothetical protein OXB84_02485, partial [Halobacteriovoraceae bacterium]|nr:hypothetical protein [Halobacteriovoraceae bacterium]